MSDPNPLFEQVARERLIFNEPPTGPIPVTAADLTEHDHLVRRTDNGLRPEDLVLGQPPQDPAWRPDAER